MQLVAPSPSAYQTGDCYSFPCAIRLARPPRNEYVHFQDLSAEGHRQSTLNSIMQVKVNDSLQWSEAFRILQIKSACQSWQCRKGGITCVRNRDSCKQKMVSVLSEDYMEFSVANQIVNLLCTCDMISLHKDISRLWHGATDKPSPTPPLLGKSLHLHALIVQCESETLKWFYFSYIHEVCPM
jgi:hypothetical protein